MLMKSLLRLILNENRGEEDFEKIVKIMKDALQVGLINFYNSCIRLILIQ